MGQKSQEKNFFKKFKKFLKKGLIFVFLCVIMCKSRHGEMAELV